MVSPPRTPPHVLPKIENDDRRGLRMSSQVRFRREESERALTWTPNRVIVAPECLPRGALKPEHESWIPYFWGDDTVYQTGTL